MGLVGRFALLLFATLTLALVAAFRAGPLWAQSTPISIEGTGGDVDSKHRGPVLSVSTSVEEGSTKILVDAYSPIEYYNRYPFQFDFYVNRHLFSTQIRSPELPGPVGIDVPHSVAPLPLNYSVIAKILAPNRTFNSAVFGAVFATSLSTELDCTLTVDADDEDFATSYVANGVDTSQAGSDSFTIAFEGTAVDDEGTATVDGTIAVSGSEASGTLTSELTDEDPSTVAMSGTATLSNGSLTAVDLSSVDGATTLKCS